MSDPYEETPDEQQLPDDDEGKPAEPVEIPDDPVAPPTDQEENEAGEPDFSTETQAADDDTIDDAEEPEDPHEDLPEGASAADYEEDDDAPSA